MTETRQSRYKASHPWVRLLEYARRRCTDPTSPAWKSHGGKGIRCSISLAEVETLWHRDNTASLRQPSLDRIDATLDYTLANCRIIEHWANGRLPHEEIPEWVTRPDAPQTVENVGHYE